MTREAIRTIIRRVLTRAGYHVDVAASAPQARSMDPAGYDALLVDAHLGRERGTALIQALVAEDPAAAGRCLLITGGKPDAWFRRVWSASPSRSARMS